MTSEPGTPKYGRMRAQVYAVSLAHGALALVHFLLVFGLERFSRLALDYSLSILAAAYDVEPDVAELVREEMASSLDWLVGALTVLVVVFSILIALNGCYLWQGRNWARINAIVFGALLVLTFPVGTPIGIWFIIVMAHKDVIPWYKTHGRRP